MNTRFRIWKTITAAMGSLSLIFLSACAGGLQSSSISTPVLTETQPSRVQETQPVPVQETQPTTAEPQTTEGSVPEVIVYTSDLPADSIFELEIWDDPAAAGGTLLGITNNGDELDPPPENDPYVTFEVPVQSGIPYRCWIHMLVGAPRGKSSANIVWAQFSGAVNGAGEEVFKPGTGSYLTATGPTEEGWKWVGCDPPGQVSPADSFIYFQRSAETTVRLQAGMEGVRFDQFLLSPAKFLDQPPSDAIIKK